MRLFDSMMLALAEYDTGAISKCGPRDSCFSCEKTGLSIIRHCLLLMILREVQPLLKWHHSENVSPRP